MQHSQSTANESHQSKLSITLFAHNEWCNDCSTSFRCTQPLSVRKTHLKMTASIFHLQHAEKLNWD